MYPVLGSVRLLVFSPSLLEVLVESSSPHVTRARLSDGPVLVTQSVSPSGVHIIITSGSQQSTRL
jgi:hypothetical protein